MMGIRMHLAVGYGLDLSPWVPDIRRFMNYERLEDADLFQRFKDDVLRFADREEDLGEKLSWHPGAEPATDFADMIVFDDEFGFSDKALFIPSGQRKSWRRYGDLLDTFLYEAEHPDLNMTPTWTGKPGTLYPYVGLMRENPDKPLGVEKYWVPCYMDHPKHKDAVAWAPWHLWFLIKHLFEVQDVMATKMFLSLRPTIYKHWS